MNGIQHIFRQQAVDKQTSLDSWHSANPSFSTSYSSGRDSNNDLKPPIWNQGMWEKCLCNTWCNTNLLYSFPSCTFTDRVLEHLQENSKKTSSPQPVPTVMKSPTQEANGSIGSNSSSSRWKRSSPDPNKMMLGRSPMDNNAKRILATTPRRASHQVERVGSPSLSGYPVRDSSSLLSQADLMTI